MDIFGFKSILLLALVYIPLERVVPHRREQGPFRPNWQTDLVYLLLNGILTRIGLTIAIVSITGAAAWVVPGAVKAWVGGLPFVPQFALLLVLSELGYYAMHRAFHTPALWRFHAVHHSSERLDWLAGHRVHALDQVLTKSASFVPVFALGFSDEATLLYALTFFWQADFLHSNIRVNFGPLRWLVATPQFHHWHHANQPEYLRNTHRAHLRIVAKHSAEMFFVRKNFILHGKKHTGAINQINNG